jgi:hypothetical protein
VAEGTALELRQALANGRAVGDVDTEDVFLEQTGRRVDDDEEEEEVTVDG